jgi:excisionase family DNA binding protein
MAKMFYTLEEAAQTLGVSEDEVKQMVEDGKLQQFRDRDQVMFKRDQVDQLASGGAPSADDSGGGEEDEDDSEITLMPDEETEASKTDSINLSGDTGAHEAQSGGSAAGAEESVGVAESEESEAPVGGESAGQEAGASGSEGDESSGSGEDEGEKKKSATGISVFGADEVEAADAMEETQVGADTFGDEEINFDGGGGSGSGLLDLTRESDDTSLGAVDLLEDEDAESGEGGDTQQEEAEDDNAATMPATSGVFEEGGEASPVTVGATAGAGAATAAYAFDESDPPGDGFGGGMLFGVFITLIAALLVVVTGMQGVIIELTAMLSQNDSAPWMYGAVGFAGVCIVLSVVGWLIGRSRG